MSTAGPPRLFPWIVAWLFVLLCGALIQPRRRGRRSEGGGIDRGKAKRYYFLINRGNLIEQLKNTDLSGGFILLRGEGMSFIFRLAKW